MFGIQSLFANLLTTQVWICLLKNSHSRQIIENTDQFQEYVPEMQVLIPEMQVLTPENWINILSVCSHQATPRLETDVRMWTKLHQKLTVPKIQTVYVYWYQFYTHWQTSMVCWIKYPQMMINVIVKYSSLSYYTCPSPNKARKEINLNKGQELCIFIL